MADGLRALQRSAGAPCSRSMARPRVVRPVPLVPLGAVLLSLSLACGRPPPTARDLNAPVAVPTALPEQPQEIHELPVEITDGRFQAREYDTQTGPVRLLVTTHGGPYTLTIDPLVSPRTLPADARTPVDFTAPDPGSYTMQLSGGGASDTATLVVRRPGF